MASRFVCAPHSFSSLVQRKEEVDYDGVASCVYEKKKTFSVYSQVRLSHTVKRKKKKLVKNETGKFSTYLSNC